MTKLPRISKRIAREVDLTAAFVFSVLARRARHASNIEGDLKVFYCPVERDEAVQASEQYRPIADQIPFLKGQAIRQCIKRLEEAKLLTVLRSGNHLDWGLSPSGKIWRKRTHRYSIKDEELEHLQVDLNNKSKGYVCFDMDDAVRHGLPAAIVINHLAYVTNLQRKKFHDGADVVSCTVHKLARRVCLSEKTVRRALKRVCDVGVVQKVSQCQYRLVAAPAPMQLADSFKIPVRETVPAPVPLARSAVPSLFSLGTSKAALSVSTGIGELDEKIQGFSKGELAFLVGQTGHGKTITMLNFAVGAAMAGQKALIFSLEMSQRDLQDRLVSLCFEQESGSVRRGEVDAAALFQELPESTKAKLGNIRIADASQPDVATLRRQTEDCIKEGFKPDVVFVDQFSFLVPTASGDQATYRLEKAVADDLARWVSTSGHQFALWCLHQANGDPSLLYGREAISGCKAVIEAAALAVGIGHTDREPRKLKLFSLKSRHDAGFELTLPCDFNKMKVGKTSFLNQLKLVS